MLKPWHPNASNRPRHKFDPWYLKCGLGYDVGENAFCSSQNPQQHAYISKRNGLKKACSVVPKKSEPCCRDRQEKGHSSRGNNSVNFCPTPIFFADSALSHQDGSNHISPKFL